MEATSGMPRPELLQVADAVAREKDPIQQTAETATTIDGHHQFDLCLETFPHFKMRGTGQRAVDPRGTDFKVIGTRNRIFDIQKGRNRTADFGAIFNIDAAFRVRAICHDLQDIVVLSRHGNTDQLEPQRIDRRLDNCRDFRHQRVFLD